METANRKYTITKNIYIWSFFLNFTTVAPVSLQKIYIYIIHSICFTVRHSFVRVMLSRNVSIPYFWQRYRTGTWDITIFLDYDSIDRSIYSKCKQFIPNNSSWNKYELNLGNLCHLNHVGKKRKQHLRFLYVCVCKL